MSPNRSGCSKTSSSARSARGRVRGCANPCYLDGGYAAASQFVERNWLERMRKPRRPLRDPKTVLQDWAQSKGLPTPVYREIERTGPHHDPQFRVAVDLPGLVPAEGVGGSKRAAEKVATRRNDPSGRGRPARTAASAVSLA